MLGYAVTHCIEDRSPGTLSGAGELAHDTGGRAHGHQLRGCAGVRPGRSSLCDLHRNHGSWRQQRKVPASAQHLLACLPALRLLP